MENKTTEEIYRDLRLKDILPPLHAPAKRLLIEYLDNLFQSTQASAGSNILFGACSKHPNFPLVNCPLCKAESQTHIPSGAYSYEDMRNCFNAAKEGGIERVPVVIDQYGSTNIEEHFVANKYKTFEDYIKTHIPSAGWSDEEIEKMAEKYCMGRVINTALGAQYVELVRIEIIEAFKAALQSQGKWSDEVKKLQEENAALSKLLADREKENKISFKF